MRGAAIRTHPVSTSIVPLAVLRRAHVAIQAVGLEHLVRAVHVRPRALLVDQRLLLVVVVLL